MNTVLGGYGRRGNAQGGTVVTFGFNGFLLVQRVMRVLSRDNSMAFATSGATRQVSSQEMPAVVVSASATTVAMSTVRNTDTVTQRPDLTHETRGPDPDVESTLPETDHESQAQDLAADSALYDETVETTIPATLKEDD